MRNVKVIKKSNGNAVAVGTTFTAEGPGGKKMKYTIVGSNESDPAAGKISNESPLGQAFLGKKVGESVEVKAPAGTIVFKIASID
jgi:transcription elongation factor GreA